MKNNFIYLPLKSYVKVFLHSFFKNYQIQGIENVPEGPVIFASNHQNAFMDALLVTCATKRNPYFLARASIFKREWSSYLLKIIRLIPVYRIRDGFSTLKKNEIVFDKCISLLSEGECILIFPEGNHHNRYHLRPFQKGIARIAFESELKFDFRLGLKIVPLGIQYEDYDKIGSSVLVSFGEPLSMEDYEHLYRNDKNMAFQKLLSDLKESISKLMVDITQGEHYEEIFQLWKNTRVKIHDLRLRLKNDQKVLRDINMVKSLPTEQKQERKSKFSVQTFFNVMTGLLSKINLIIPYLFVSYIINNKLKEPMFEGSVRFALWAFPGMLVFAIQAGVIYMVSEDLLISFGYLVSTMLIALISVKTRPENE